MNFTPVAISALIVAAVAFLGAIIAYVRDRGVYKNHEEYRDDAIALAKEFKGSIFRDGNDLVLNGVVEKLPFVVRFSYGEGTPGLNIRANVPANFQMSISPKRARAAEGKTELRTTDRAFDAMFTVRSNYPTQAKLFIDRTTVMRELQKLCCSTDTFFGVSSGMAEVSELLVPRATRKHVTEHIRSLLVLSNELRQMPFADRVVVKTIHRERRWVIKVSLAVGMVAALVAIVSATRQPAELPLPATSTDVHVPPGMPPADGAVLSNLEGWRLATDSDLDQDAVAWLRARGIGADARMTGDFDGLGNQNDIVYLLVNVIDGERRLVLLVDHKPRLDVKYAYLGIVARIPKSNLSQVEWSSRKPEPPDGDAILLTRTPQDRSSGLILYLSEGKLASGTPANYQAVDPVP